MDVRVVVFLAGMTPPLDPHPRIDSSTLISRRLLSIPWRHRPRTRLARAAVVDGERPLPGARLFGDNDRGDQRALRCPAATVYRLFSSKRGILKALLDVAIAGDGNEVPVADRPAVQSLLAEPDPRRKLAPFVAVVSQVNWRTSPI